MLRRCVIALFIAGSVVASTMQGGSPQTPAAPRGFVEQYCRNCHTQVAKDKGIVPLALDTFDPAKVTLEPEVAEKVIRKVRAGLMPPPGSPHPDAAAIQSFL